MSRRTVEDLAEHLRRVAALIDHVAQYAPDPYETAYLAIRDTRRAASELQAWADSLAPVTPATQAERRHVDITHAAITADYDYEGDLT